MNINFKVQLVEPKVIVRLLKGEKGDAGDAGDYSTLANKPSINNITLNGNQTGTDLGLVPKQVTDALDNRISSLESNSVPKTRTVNNKALSSDVEIKAEDVPYTNTTSGLTATDVQAAIDEMDGTVDGILSDMVTKSQVKTGRVTQVTANSTDTIITRGLISGAGFYFIVLQTDTTSANTGSVYTLRRTSSAWVVNPMFEGTHNSAPRIDSNGVLKLNGNTSNHGMYYLVIQMVS